MERDGEGRVEVEYGEPIPYRELPDSLKGVTFTKQWADEMDPRTSRHPSSNPSFDAKREHKVYYLSHPLAPDDSYTFEQNMAHVVHMVKLFFEEGWFVIAPYHTICLALDDDNPDHRVLGLECDCNIARLMGNLVLTGHKISKGMQNEAEQAMACKNGGIIHNFVGYNDDELRAALRFLKNGGTLESDTAVRKEV
jgi:hypothetical protein